MNSKIESTIDKKWLLPSYSTRGRFSFSPCLLIILYNYCLLLGFIARVRNEEDCGVSHIWCPRVTFCF
ncbi:hypothetical protein AWC38_SpisGene17835 [Stylophora pistillata]|uniref:Uncharacterized protein n=1 Tax=Stylophora pistillata TaxID=50429 RepID=A0A2B4RLX5_STYPI|nr:hypothetical protein AWC38_SpisGene17835 [Stylophora pistillata]